jgi:hypothetical protein
MFFVYSFSAATFYFLCGVEFLNKAMSFVE